jgi:hypothetical protein
MPLLSYTKPHRWPKLVAELEQALVLRYVGDGLPAATFTAWDNGDAVSVLLPPGVDPALVDAVLAAHDAAAPAPSEAGVSTRADVDALLAALAAAVTQTGQARTILAGASWDTLSPAQRTNAAALLLANQERILRALAYLARRS